MKLRTSAAPAVCLRPPSWDAGVLIGGAPQRKITFRATTMTSEMTASLVGDWYQGRRTASGSVRCSFGVSEYTSPTSSDAGLGRVTCVTTTLTTMSTTNAALAAVKEAP